MQRVWSLSGAALSDALLPITLQKLGWKDIVLLERKQLTSGTTARGRAYRTAARDCEYDKTSQVFTGTLRVT